MANDSRDAQSLLSKNNLTYDEEAVYKQFKSLKLLIEENKKMHINPIPKDLQRLKILRSAVDKYKKIDSLKKIFQKKSEYNSIKNDINTMRNKIILLINEIINVLKIYKTKSNSTLSNRSTEIKKLESYMLSDLQTLKKQKI